MLYKLALFTLIPLFGQTYTPLTKVCRAVDTRTAPVTASTVFTYSLQRCAIPSGVSMVFARTLVLPSTSLSLVPLSNINKVKAPVMISALEDAVTATGNIAVTAQGISVYTTVATRLIVDIAGYYKSTIVSGATDSTCTPTAEQLANRVSPQGIPQLPRSVPPIGTFYCDSAFGTRVTRVSTKADETVDVKGQVAFSPDRLRLLTFTTSGGVRLYKREKIEATFDAGADLPAGQNILWGTNKDVLYMSGMDFKLLDTDTMVSTLAYSAGELTSTIKGAALQRCSGSRNASTVACSIMDDQYRRVGYIVIRNDGTGYKMLRKYLNGVDSPDMSTFESAGSYTLTSPYEIGVDARGGYKLSVDRSGSFLLFSTWDAQGDSARYNTMAVLELSTGVWRYIQGAGHGDVGDGVFLGINTAYGSCGSCVKLWTLPKLTSDPSVEENNGTPLTSPFGYTSPRQYASAYSATGKGALAFSCPNTGCPGVPIPYVGELLSVSYGGQLARIAQLYAKVDAGYLELQPMLSEDGKELAATMNYGANERYVVVIDVPE